VSLPGNFATRSPESRLQGCTGRKPILEKYRLDFHVYELKTTFFVYLLFFSLSFLPMIDRAKQVMLSHTVYHLAKLLTIYYT